MNILSNDTATTGRFAIDLPAIADYFPEVSMSTDYLVASIDFTDRNEPKPMMRTRQGEEVAGTWERLSDGSLRFTHATAVTKKGA